MTFNPGCNFYHIDGNAVKTWEEAKAWINPKFVEKVRRIADLLGIDRARVYVRGADALKEHRTIALFHPIGNGACIEFRLSPNGRYIYAEALSGFTWCQLDWREMLGAFWRNAVNRIIDGPELRAPARNGPEWWIDVMTKEAEYTASFIKRADYIALKSEELNAKLIMKMNKYALQVTNIRSIFGRGEISRMSLQSFDNSAIFYREPNRANYDNSSLRYYRHRVIFTDPTTVPNYDSSNYWEAQLKEKDVVDIKLHDVPIKIAYTMLTQIREVFKMEGKKQHVLDEESKAVSPI